MFGLHWPTEQQLLGIVILLILWNIERQISGIREVQKEIKQKLEWLANRQWDKDRGA